MVKPILVDRPMNCGFAMESLMLNITGTTPYPKTTTPNQLLAADKLSGQKFRCLVSEKPDHPLSLKPSQEITLSHEMRTH